MSGEIERKFGYIYRSVSSTIGPMRSGGIEERVG
jgi:hypothetical protein